MLVLAGRIRDEPPVLAGRTRASRMFSRGASAANRLFSRGAERFDGAFLARFGAGCTVAITLFTTSRGSGQFILRE